MTSVYPLIRRRARQIASRFPTPEFYIIHAQANTASVDFFQTDPTISHIRAFVLKHIENDFGHGMAHATKVTVDAGALLLIEGRDAGYTDDLIQDHMRLVQSAGLLHDIKRKQKDHAIAGARFARVALKDFPFRGRDVEKICHAIRNHEAFKHRSPSGTPEGDLISDCLYDADKFRWGPDNFKDTIWDMVSFSNMAFPDFVARYPKGMDSLNRIKQSFRTPSGQKYGPQFIDHGIRIGEQLLDVIQNEFAEYL